MHVPDRNSANRYRSVYMFPLPASDMDQQFRFLMTRGNVVKLTRAVS